VGPAFDGGDRWSELAAVWQPFNGENNCCSWANNPGYEIGNEKDGTNKLTRKMNGHFTITDLEVWSLKHK
jgi:hypothetical protein